MTAPVSRRSCLAGAALLLLAGCAAIDPRNVTLSQAELQALFERQFPRQQRLAELLDVSLARPTLRLVPQRNRIATGLELSATELLTRRSLRGSFSIEHALRYEPSDATVRLSNVKIDALQLELAGTPLSGQAARLGAMLAERVLDDFVVYRVAEDRRRMLESAGVNNADFAVTARGIELRFAPAR
jgi:hypothetical protein